jgi:DNA-binding CsgD family transcriptional regulator
MSNTIELNADPLVEKIYSATLQPDLWSAVLDGLAERVGAVGSALFIQRNGNWLGWRASRSLEPAASELTAQFIFADKPLPQRLKDMNRPGFVADHEICEAEEFKQYAFYKGFCEPCGLLHTAATVINLPMHDLLFLFTTRAKDRSPFSVEELDHLNVFRPHIARAGMLTARLGFEKMRSFTDAFSSISLPAVIIDPDCNIIAKNSRIDECAGFIKQRSDAVLEFNSPGSTKILKETAKLLDKRISSSAKSIPIASPDDAHAIAHIIPVGSEYAGFFDWQSVSSKFFHSACCSVIITPVSPTHGPDKALLRALFDLTPAEIKVAEEILHGHNTGKIAGSLGVTQETVRTHLKRIFMKTGVQSQAQLVSVLAGITKVRPENRKPGKS